MTKRRTRTAIKASTEGAPASCDSSARAPQSEEAASPAADGVHPTLYPLPGDTDALKWLGAAIVMVLIQMEVPGRLSPGALAQIQADRDILRAYLRADLAFDRLIKDHSTGAALQDFTPTLPALNDANRALCNLAFRLFMPAVNEAAMRDMAAAELLAGRAWVAPDKTIIRAPTNAAA